MWRTHKSQVSHKLDCWIFKLIVHTWLSTHLKQVSTPQQQLKLLDCLPLRRPTTIWLTGQGQGNPPDLQPADRKSSLYSLQHHKCSLMFLTIVLPGAASYTLQCSKTSFCIQTFPLNLSLYVLQHLQNNWLFLYARPFPVKLSLSTHCPQRQSLDAIGCLHTPALPFLLHTKVWQQLKTVSLVHDKAK